jgi:hypothetical protein
MSVTGYTGKLGAGKTMSAVREALCRMDDAGGPALLITPISVKVPEPHIFYQFALGPKWPEEVARLVWGVSQRGHYLGTPIVYIVLLLPEAGVVMGARDWQSFPMSLRWVIAESRHFQMDVIWDAQYLTQVDSILRGITDVIYDIRCIPAASFGRRRRGKRPTFLYWRTYNGEGEYRKRGKGGMLQWCRYPRWMESIYDTDQIVVPPGFLADGGLLDAIDTAPLARRSGASDSDHSVVVLPATGKQASGARGR